MAITKIDEVLDAIQKGKTNDEIRCEIDGRLSDNRLNKLRAHPNVGGGGNEMKRDVDIEREVKKIFAPTINADDEQLAVQIAASGDEGKKLAVAGVCVAGILEYYVTPEDIMIDNDRAITPDHIDDLIAELKELKAVHRKVVKGEL